ncbi:efflux RND transporter periplasmic adaptor subunit [Legionella maioricensis]|uniref:Efflux RND transporter periplasmic adaptor subunit n=1 Tax=Legionella maioricensis TaxID=2896528 RepID=A0A9X2D0C7_9GAMM|nr:efflux RND transporter periplasmic adaptor subunit [Legionella maioricensis]MCL9683898.1 efflux RND transporter periplasmic adaptor subunit [Legionella maioricensis]MCL9686745.1 efflux RND transporter periplasmic adaptor subunit [Legionella maioricensis]
MIKRIHSQFKTQLDTRWIAIISFVCLILLIVIGFRIYAAIVLRQQTNANLLPVVATTIPIQVTGTEKIILPGNVQAWHEAPIYARTNGYIKKWYVDIGSHVKKGDLLAVIETPELDAQYAQAKADLNTAIANNKLAQSTAKRWVNLLKTDSVSKQETDEKVSSAAALNAAMISAQANVDRLKELVSFERVIAPFDGVITFRNIDIGSLINEGSSTTGVLLFRLSQTNPLRIYVNIPQNYTSRITANMTVSLTFAEHPGQVFTAKLVNTAQAIDPASFTLLAQFSAENKKGILLPGGYTEVSFNFAVLPGTVRLPVNTLIFQAAGLQVATLDKDNRVVLKSIKISRDFGSEVEIESGISPGERIIINPPDALTNREKVRVAS